MVAHVSDGSWVDWLAGIRCMVLVGWVFLWYFVIGCEVYLASVGYLEGRGSARRWRRDDGVWVDAARQEKIGRKHGSDTICKAMTKSNGHEGEEYRHETR